MHALRYFFSEAAASLWRRRRAALLAVLTIASGLFVLGFFLVLNANLQRLVGRWSESAELSVYLRDEATSEQVGEIDDFIGKSGLAAARERVSREQAAARFREDFPDLASTADRLESNPFPASIEVRVRPDLREADTALDALAANLAALPGVADVRYDRRWVSRLNGAVRLVRGIGLLIVVVLAIAAALTVANVVRLAAVARSDEIEIMQLVGAPHAYVRGPFVVEGILQGGGGAVAAIALLWGLFAVIRARYGAIASDVMGIGDLTFLPAALWLGLIVGGMLLGCAGGFIVARGVR